MKDYPCPICRTKTFHTERYPYMVYNSCASKAIDNDNQNMEEVFYKKYFMKQHYIPCTIDKIQVIAQENYWCEGSLVIQSKKAYTEKFIKELFKTKK